VLFQLPRNLKSDLPLLTDFLAGLPHHVRLAFEFRHDSWFRDDVFASLHGSKVALCLAEREKLKTPDVHTTDFSYMRMRKEEYSAKVRKALRQKVLNLAQKREVFSLLLGWRSIALSEGIFDQSFDEDGRLDYVAWQAPAAAVHNCRRTFASSGVLLPVLVLDFCLTELAAHPQECFPSFVSPFAHIRRHALRSMPFVNIVNPASDMGGDQSNLHGAPDFTIRNQTYCD